MQHLLGPGGCLVPTSHWFAGSWLCPFPPPTWSRHQMTWDWIVGMVSLCVSWTAVSLLPVYLPHWTPSGAIITTSHHVRTLFSTSIMDSLAFRIQCKLTSWAHLACDWLPSCVASSVHNESTMLSLAWVPWHSPFPLPGMSVHSFAE